MQISFTHTEIREALIEYLEKQITLAPGQTVSLEFDLDDPTDIIAYVDVLREGQKAKGMPAKPEQEKTVSSKPVETPAPRKTRGPNKPKVEDAPLKSPDGLGSEEVQIPEPGIPAAVEEEVAIKQAAAPSDVPFQAPFADPAATAEAVNKIAAANEAAAQAVENSKTVEGPAPKPANSIFPNAGSSAPVVSTQAISTTPGPKSLFAGLLRPTNAPTAH